MKVLLVEDEEGLVLTLSDRLRSEGFEIKTAADGRAGFELGRSEKFDLMILDVMLPKKNARICRDLRRSHLDPYLMRTQKARPWTRCSDKARGGRLLPKPFEMIDSSPG